MTAKTSKSSRILRIALGLAVVTFSLAFRAAAQIEMPLYNFGGMVGDYPWAGLISDEAGNLYGTAVYGGDLSGCAYLGAAAQSLDEDNPSGRR